jgi:hypothetical protein
MAGPAYRPGKLPGGRSMRGVLLRWGMGVKFKSLISPSKENNIAGGGRFPLSDGGEARPSSLLASWAGRGLRRSRTVAERMGRR